MRLHPRYRLKVPNGMALAGAFLLAASSLAGVSGVLPSLQEPAATTAGIASANSRADTAPLGVEPAESTQPAAAGKRKRFKVSLFLFRR